MVTSTVRYLNTEMDIHMKGTIPVWADLNDTFFK